MKYDKVCLETFLKKQGQLFDEPVADDLEEAAFFLEDVDAMVFSKAKEVVAYFRENLDVSGMSDREILESPEVFALSDGRFMVVEG